MNAPLLAHDRTGHSFRRGGSAEEDTADDYIQRLRQEVARRTRYLAGLPDCAYLKTTAEANLECTWQKLEAAIVAQRMATR
jgi:hypothetical protein